MFDHYFRQLKDRLLGPIARWLGGRVHPDCITLLGLVAGLATALLAAGGLRVPAFACWVLNRVLDGLDGSVARASGQQTDFGGYLDVVLDFVVYATVPVGMVVGAPAAAAWGAVTFLLATFYINAASWLYLSSILEARHLGAATRQELTTVHMPPGVIAGTETLVLYSLFLLFPAVAPRGFWLMGGLVLVNVVLRLAWARRRL